MSKGVEFKYMVLNSTPKGRAWARSLPHPPYVRERDQIFGRFTAKEYSGQVVAAIMWDYYSVGAEEQRQMVLNTIALCELKYNQQEIDHV